ncbi:Zn-dependent peptidase ImmA (M78 family) [Azospirillum lipoferum]|nr:MULTISPECIES: ImmA/IrrE family metallo-endopeptidase [Azospirillum]MCP1612136.1 Zn-dependent peptidase ImmA (M78 family) [Azospirillum lipoferum]
MTNFRDAILSGTKAAAKLHREFHHADAVKALGGGVDVFGATINLGAVLIFRPLEGLLGACIPGQNPGVMISTQRALRIQRFTGAHELGHVVMRHELKIDGEEILARAPSQGGYDLQEIEADAFAAEFLMPKWVFQAHARRQGWNKESMEDPCVVYQMALRIGASYDATCRALNRHSIIDGSTREKLLRVERKRIKKSLLGDVAVENWHRDVWLLTERDEGTVIEGQPEDCFVLRLRERSSAGYVWNFKSLQEAGFAILRDTRDIPSPETAIGGVVSRLLTLRRDEPDLGELSVEQRRPWLKTGAPLSKFQLKYDLLGKEIGMPRAVRRQLTAA